MNKINTKQRNVMSWRRNATDGRICLSTAIPWHLTSLHYTLYYTILYYTADQRYCGVRSNTTQHGALQHDPFRLGTVGYLMIILVQNWRSGACRGPETKKLDGLFCDWFYPISLNPGTGPSPSAVARFLPVAASIVWNSLPVHTSSLRHLSSRFDNG